MNTSLEECLLKIHIKNKINNEQFNKLIEESLLKENFFYLSQSCYLCLINKYKLSSKNINKLIKHTDFKQFDSIYYNQLMYIFRHKQYHQFSENQLFYIIKKSNIKQVSKFGASVLSYALTRKSCKDLNLNNSIWDYLIKNSDLSLITNDKQLMELKNIQSELLNYEILNKIDIKEENKKTSKI